MASYNREFIQFLESAGVLKFGDFTAKSGRKIPYFINAGDIKTGDQISKLGEFYAKAYFEKVGNRRTVLYGPAYKGIPIAVSVACALSKEGLDVPFFFNRKEEKDHGEGGVFVGYKPQEGEEIVIVEDVITAGTAIRKGQSGTLGEIEAKPHPWLYAETAMALGVTDKSRIVGIEDSAAGVMSIRLAGFAALGVAGGNLKQSGMMPFLYDKKENDGLMSLIPTILGK